MTDQKYELPAARKAQREARLAKIDAMFAADATVPEMVEATGASKPTIYSDLRDLGHRTPDGWTNEARERQAEKTAIVHARRRRQRTAPAKCEACSHDAVERFKGRWLCAACLLADGADPDYEAIQREETMRGFRGSAVGRADEVCYGAPAPAEHGNLLRSLNKAMRKHGLMRSKKPAGPVKYTDRPLMAYAEVER